MNESTRVAERFDENRKHLRAVAYRMLGSLSEADDAVQETWLRLDRSDTGDIANLTGWLTTVIARVCLDMLRARKSRREEPRGAHVSESIVRQDGGTDPEQESVLADSVGLALLVVLETLTPAERLAFVLHDVFGVPFEEIASTVGRSVAAAKQLASRARRRVRGAAVPDVELPRQRAVVEAFLAASQSGDFGALLAVLDADVVARADAIAVRGARAVAKQAIMFSRGSAKFARPALVNGMVGLVVAPKGRLTTVLAFKIAGTKIVQIDIFGDSAHFHHLNLGVLPD